MVDPETGEETEEYAQYLELSLPMLRVGGVVICDNLLWGGQVAGEIRSPDQTASTQALREFNIDAQLGIYTTTGGVKKKARYRWSWEKKFNRTVRNAIKNLIEINQLTL